MRTFGCLAALDVVAAGAGASAVHAGAAAPTTMPTAASARRRCLMGSSTPWGGCFLTLRLPSAKLGLGRLVVDGDSARRSELAAPARRAGGAVRRGGRVAPLRTLASRTSARYLIRVATPRPGAVASPGPGPAQA